MCRLGLAGTAALLTRARPTLTVDESTGSIAGCTRGARGAAGLAWSSRSARRSASCSRRPALVWRSRASSPRPRPSAPSIRTPRRVREPRPVEGRGQPGGPRAPGRIPPVAVREPRNLPSLADTARARRSEDTRNSLSAAEARPNAPFTGFAAIPILMAGIAFTVTGASSIADRRPTSASWWSGNRAGCSSVDGVAAAPTRR